MVTIQTLPRTNPFSTCRTSPGKIHYLFESSSESYSTSAAEIVDEFLSQGGAGQIVGAHGSGKSTLVAELLPLLLQHFSNAQNIVVRRRSVIDCVRSESELNSAGSNRRLFVIDGIERLSAFDRFALKRYCRRRGFGLLATTHRAIYGLPVLYRMETGERTFSNIVERLQSESPEKVGLRGVERAFASSNGNIRESLMQLYDVWEDLT